MRARIRASVFASVLVTALAALPPLAIAATPRCFGQTATIVARAGQEVIHGTEGSDVIAGGPASETIYGGGGRDRICGRGGWDFIHGGAEDDRLDGGAYWDSMWGGPGDDLIRGGTQSSTCCGPGHYDDARYTNAGGPIRANLDTGRARGQGHDTLVSIEQLVGSRFDDVLIGSFRADNNLVGGGGDDELYGGDGIFDLLAGGPGDDFLDGGGDRMDQADYSFWTPARHPVVADLSAGTAAGQGTDTLVGLDKVIGSRFDDTLVGDGTVNNFWGMAGEDSLSGLGGGDFFVPGDGDDVVDGGTGSDLAHYSVEIASEPEPITVDLAADSMVSSGSLGTDQLLSVESSEGTDLDDMLRGDDARNSLNGGGGNDTLIGLAGDDFLNGWDGTDTLDGGPGDDTCRRGEVVSNCGPAEAFASTAVARRFEHALLSIRREAWLARVLRAKA